MRDAPNDAADKLVWRWLAGAATAPEELGDPAAGANGLDLCVFDGGGDLLLGARAPGGGTCGRRPCWKSSANGRVLDYRDSAGTARGLRQLRVRAGADGRATITARAAGARLALPSLSSPSLPLVVQLQAPDGCWETRHPEETVERSTSTVFQARDVAAASAR